MKRHLQSRTQQINIKLMPIQLLTLA